MSTATLSAAQPKVTANAGKRPQLANLVWEEFQTEIDKVVKTNPKELKGPETEVKAFWIAVYKKFLHFTLNHRTIDQELKKYFSPAMQEAIYGMTVGYLCEPYMPVSDFSRLKGLSERAKSVRIKIVGRWLRIEFSGVITIENKDYDREKSPFFKSMKNFTNHVTLLLKAQQVEVAEVKEFKDWESANEYNQKITKSTSVRSLKTKRPGSTGRAGGSRPSGRSSRKPVLANGKRIGWIEVDKTKTAAKSSQPQTSNSKLQTTGGYPGSKNGHGVKQAIRNQVPEYKIFISGFLGDDPLFRELPVRAANYGFEISPAVIAERWPAFTKAPAAKSSYVSGNEVGLLMKGISLELWRTRYQQSTDNGQLTKAIFNSDFLSWFSASAAKLDRDTFIYLDPPYLISTQKNVERDYYGDHVLTDHQHRELLKLARSTRALVAISGYDNPLYDKMLAAPKWRKVNYQRRTHGGMVTETLWMNYPEPVKLADYSMLGDNHITRQMHKRKKERWLGKLAAMNEKERNALLTAIRKKYPA